MTYALNISPLVESAGVSPCWFVTKLSIKGFFFYKMAKDNKNIQEMQLEMWEVFGSLFQIELTKRLLSGMDEETATFNLWNLLMCEK